MITERETLIIYTAAICNLKCTYCYIDKNPALKEIDDILDESFKGDYYFNFTKQMFPDPYQLKEIQTWGGEPFISMHRAYDLIENIINYYPNFNSFFSSTNFTVPNWIEEFEGLINIFKKHPNRKFNVTIQLSIDGPEYINDRNRGKGVTNKFINTFDQLVEWLPNHLPDNVTLHLQPKPTFNMDSVKELLDKQRIIEYYQFLEQFLYKIAAINKPNVIMYANVPNTAAPCPHTKEDGVIFAKLCQLTREIEKENIEKNYFKYYKEITLYSSGYACNESLTMKCTGFTCGTGFSNVGLLPYNKISTCHNGFVDLIADYKKLAQNSNDIHDIDFRIFMEKTKSRFCLSLEDYRNFELQMKKYYTPNTTARLTNMVTLIMSLAYGKQIKEKYTNPDEALKAARFIRNNTAFCVRDNQAITGCLTLQPNGIYKLLLNGAMEAIENA